MTMTIIAAMTLTIALVACVTDIRSRRIPNVLTFGAAVAGLLFHLATGGRDAGFDSAMGYLAGTAIFLPFFLLGGMGAGDIKLLAALGAWIGPHDVLWLAAYTSITGGVFAVGLGLMRGYLRTALRNVLNLVQFWWLTGFRPHPEVTLERGAGPRLAYAIPIFIGTAVTLWVR
jgi:prepilin peptidase CpaA